MSHPSIFATLIQSVDMENSCPNENYKGFMLQISPLNLDGGLIEIPHETFVLGRDENCPFVVRDESVSRRHSVIEFEDSQYRIRDLRSTNGTWVNEEKVTSQALIAGDRIRLGNHIFKFLSADHIETQYHETVYDMMTRDGLTKIYNKRYLLEVLGREIERSRRHARPLALIMFDIDHFKQVNDVHGHLVGDEVLQEVSRRAGELLRHDDVLARYGGEEFSVILSEATMKGARRTAERIRSLIADEPFHTSAGDLEITVSLGIAVTCGKESTTTLLIQEADAQLYAAKHAGRNRVCS